VICDELTTLKYYSTMQINCSPL